jgi:hypothetical protein
VLKNEKRLLKKNAVNYIHVPAYDELSVKRLWEDLKDDVEFMVFFSDGYAKDRAPCREYFFNILNTVYPDYLKQIMDNASLQRFTAQGADMKEQAIKATDEWYQELQAMPFISSKYLI